MSRIQPVLASTLYGLETSQKSTSISTSASSSWRTGVKEVDEEIDVFRDGSIIGVCGAGEFHAQAQRLMHELATTHLFSSQTHTRSSTLAQTSKQHPRIFIIESPTTSSASTSLLQIYTLLSSSITSHRRHRNPTSREEEIDRLVGDISILPSFDLIGVSQALSEISELLHHQQQSIESGGGEKTLVLIRGLGGILASMIRSGSGSGVGAGGGMSAKPFALLVQVFRQMRRLARENTNSGVLILVEMGEPTEIMAVEEGEGRLAVNSAFSSSVGKLMKFSLGNEIGSGNGRGRGVEDGLVSLLVDMVDAVVVVHDGFGVVGNEAGGSGRSIVEVVKDCNGGSMGRWTVWEK